MKEIKYSILCLLLISLLFGCAQKHVEDEPDVVSSIKINRDETLTVVANRDIIEEKEEFAELLIQKCKENSFQSIKFSTDYGYATSLHLQVYLWRDQIQEQEPVMVVKYIPVDRENNYDIIHNPDKFHMYIDGKKIE